MELLEGPEYEVRVVGKVVGSIDEPDLVESLDHGSESNQQLAAGKRGTKAVVGTESESQVVPGFLTPGVKPVGVIEDAVVAVSRRVTEVESASGWD